MSEFITLWLICQ